MIEIRLLHIISILLLFHRRILRVKTRKERKIKRVNDNKIINDNKNGFIARLINSKKKTFPYFIVSRGLILYTCRVH